MPCDNSSQIFRGTTKKLGVVEQPKFFAESAYIKVLDKFENFNQPDDIFSRGFWDKKVRNKMTSKFYRSFVKPMERARSQTGFQQRDFALRNGPWTLTEMLAERGKREDRRDGFTDDFMPHVPFKAEQVSFDDEQQAANSVKKVAKLYGADLVGITGYDERWTYRSKFSARKIASKAMDIDDGLNNVIVLAKSMNYGVIRTSPAATASTGPAIGYADDAVTLLALAQFIRSLGYRAVACQNDTTLAIPYALKAGLGEYGRSGLLITKEYGPRVRFGRVLTDMPLSHDEPIHFGVEQTCQICRRCANNCPPQAIDHGDPSDYRFNRSNIKGVVKWTTDAEKCFKFWVSKGTDCANCIRSCPYNKDFSKKRFQLIRYFLGTRFRKWALKVDDNLRLHDQLSPSKWWTGQDTEPIEQASDHALDIDKVQQQERVKRLRDARK